MVIKPCFKSAFCLTEVLHVWVTIAGRYGRLVDYSGGKALAVEGHWFWFLQLQSLGLALVSSGLLRMWLLWRLIISSTFSMKL